MKLISKQLSKKKVFFHELKVQLFVNVQ